MFEQYLQKKRERPTKKRKKEAALSSCNCWNAFQTEVVGLCDRSYRVHTLLQNQHAIHVYHRDTTKEMGECCCTFRTTSFADTHQLVLQILDIMLLENQKLALSNMCMVLHLFFYEKLLNFRAHHHTPKTSLAKLDLDILQQLAILQNLNNNSKQFDLTEVVCAAVDKAGYDIASSYITHPRNGRPIWLPHVCIPTPTMLRIIGQTSGKLAGARTMKPHRLDSYVLDYISDASSYCDCLLSLIRKEGEIDGCDVRNLHFEGPDGMSLIEFVCQRQTHCIGKRLPSKIYQEITCVLLLRARTCQTSLLRYLPIELLEMIVACVLQKKAKKRI